MIDRSLFIKNISPLARDEETRSGIKPIITITQAAHESNWGSSKLTLEANNLFGFTGDSWEAEGKPVIKMPTREYIEPYTNKGTGELVPGEYKVFQRPFRKYESWAESIRDWANLIQKPRYAKALPAAKAGDIDAYALEVSKAGYATDPSYAPLIVKVAYEIKSLWTELA